MSTIEVTHHQRRSLTDLQSPVTSETTQLDLFDPFDSLDRAINKNIHFFPSNKPYNIVSDQPKHPETYRVTFDCTDYNKLSVNTEVVNNKLIIWANESIADKSVQVAEDYYHKKFKKTLHLPRYVDTDKLVSYFLPKSNYLVVEIPIHLAQKWHRKTLHPHLVHHDRMVRLDISLPEDVSSEDLKIVCKDREVIVSAYYKHIDDRGPNKHLYRVQYIRRARFPEETCFETLKCVNIDEQDIYVIAELQHRNEIA